jgi:hypothetical protein
MLKPIHPHAIQQMQSDKSLMIAYHTLKIEKFEIIRATRERKARPAIVPSIIFIFLLIFLTFPFRLPVC